VPRPLNSSLDDECSFASSNPDFTCSSTMKPSNATTMAETTKVVLTTRIWMDRRQRVTMRRRIRRIRRPMLVGTMWNGTGAGPVLVDSACAEPCGALLELLT